MLQRSATRILEPDDVSKIGCGFKSHWDDCLHSQHVQRLRSTEKKIRTNHETSKEANLIGNTFAINYNYIYSVIHLNKAISFRIVIVKKIFFTSRERYQRIDI